MPTPAMTPEQRKAYEIALEKIEACRLEKGTVLNLSELGLSSLPPEIGQLFTLTGLYLSANELTSLPPEIGQLSALEDLNLHNNRLKNLPPEIGQLSELTRFWLHLNQLISLPPEIGQLSALTDLTLVSNQLTKLPPEIGQLSTLRGLWLQFNHLTSLPPEIGQLSALTELYLDSNHLSILPPEIGQLTALTTLQLNSNQLTSLPLEIGQLSALTTLQLDSNQLTSLPPEIGLLHELEMLFLHNNPALGISDSVLGRSWQEVGRGALPGRPRDILGFYFDQLQAREEGTLIPVNEVKVMLVGQGGAGKTSFRRFFMKQRHVPNEKETRGIALTDFPISVGGEDITVRLWDFAGQEITHAMHQFFLAEGCIYVLVVDPRSDAEEENAKYWLGLLKRYAKGAPVLIAMNKQDEREGGYDLPRRELLAAFPTIWSFTPTNCEKRVGCEKLLQELKNAVEALDHSEPPHLMVPEKWLKVMVDCDGERSRKNPHMSLEEFRAICVQNDENDSAEQERLARLLHKLGAVLHFVDEPRLRDTSVLDPHWVTDGVYRLLRFKDGPGSDGTITISKARKALGNRSEEEARFLLRLMERFEMCFPLDEEVDKPGSKWLIPGALEKFEPDGVGEEWLDAAVVRMRYVYDPLLEGVLPRFIVLTHLMSETGPRWRNGVVLRAGNASALVRRGLKRNHLEISALGPDGERLRLLEIVQGNLERINRDLPDPKPVAEIELVGFPGVYRNLADMEAAERQEVTVAVKLSTTGEELEVDPKVILNRTSDEEARTGGRLPLNVFLSYSHKDKRAKGIFQDNLAVMMSKRLISTWEDGQIEPGTLWREAIEEALDRMDVFVGLLTTPFLASHFIRDVELAAGREKLVKLGRDFLFVLIMVDDVSLNGLDLAQYQVLKPGGKPICKHPSVKAGFDVAQKELEELILKRQGQKKKSFREMAPTRTNVAGADGITIIVQGDFYHRTKFMKDDYSIHMRDNHGQVSQVMKHCTNAIHEQPAGERKDLLEELTRQVQELIAALPKEKKEKIPEIEENLEMFIKQATSEKPNRKWYEISAEGLMDASKYVKDFTANIAAPIKSLGTLVLGSGT